MNIDFDFDRDAWGAVSTWCDTDDPSFGDGVDYVLVHWGGGTRRVEEAEVPTILRGWQRYHMRVVDGRQVMSDIAYNYAVDDFGNIWRLRGLNSGGHVTCSKDRDPEGRSYCKSSIGVVWVGGKAASGGPTPEAFEALNRLVRSIGRPVTVKSHRAVKQENSSWTECPGEDLIAWVREERWVELANQVTSNPAFQPFFDKALEIGMYSKYTNVDDVMTAEKLAVFLGRVGLLESPKGSGESGTGQEDSGT